MQSANLLHSIFCFSVYLAQVISFAMFPYGLLSFLGPLFAVTPFLQESKSLHLHFGIRGTTTVLNAVVM